MKHYEPLRTYFITRIERWEQLVEVEARSEQEALLRAKDDCGTINSDPVFHSFTDSFDWTVEEVENNDPYREVAE